MKLTLASLSQTVTDELGRDPSRSSMEALINEAGEAWVNAASWTYLRDRSQDIQATTGVGSYRLGLGVRNLMAVYRPDTAWRPLHLVDYDYFESQRSEFLGDVQWQHEPLVTLQYGQEEGDDRPRLYMRLFPATLNERLTVVYQAGWLPLDKLEDVADIPAPLGQPFVAWLRLFANTREFPERYPLGTLAQWKASPEFMEARRVDGSMHKGVVPRITGTGLYYARKQLGRRGFYTRNDYLRATGESSS